jgi:hypothetical protein
MAGNVAREVLPENLRSLPDFCEFFIHFQCEVDFLQGVCVQTRRFQACPERGSNSHSYRPNRVPRVYKQG